MSAKEEKVELEGEVTESMTRFHVPHRPRQRPSDSRLYLRQDAALSNPHLAGDRVKVELSPYDLSRGRITYRHR